MIKFISNVSGGHLPGSVHRRFENVCVKQLITHLKKKYPNDKCVIIMAKSISGIFDSVKDEITHYLTSDDYRVYFVNVLDPSEIEQLLHRLCLNESDVSFTEVGDTLHPGEYSFDCLSWLTRNNFQPMTDEQLLPVHFTKCYISYARKPRQQRVMLTQALVDNNLESCGIITLGVDAAHPLHKNIGENPDDFFQWGSMALAYPYDSGNIPHTLWSLGNLDLWQGHFLHVVNEAIFNDYEIPSVDLNATRRLFLSEKIWKPMIGLRPFVLCMNPLIWYPWLENNGFKTFEEYWPVSFRDIEPTDKCRQTVNKIIEVIKWLNSKTPEELMELYVRMLPDIYHNRDRFNNYAVEQENKYQNCFL